MTDTNELVEELLHPQLGLKRGIIDFSEQGKGGRDPDSKMTNITFGELRRADKALRQQADTILSLRGALERVAERLVEQTGEPWPGGSETERLHYWRDKAIFASREMRAILNGEPTNGGSDATE